jgi:hypothetical protein
MFAMVLLVVAANADVVTYTTSVTNGQAITYSDPQPVSGTLDKIEVIKTAATTCTVTVATYSGTTAVDTYFTKAMSESTTAIVCRPRFIGTTSAAVDIASVAGTGTNTLTQLNAVYEKPMVGSNLKVAVTGTAGACDVIVRFFFKKE